MGGVTSSWGRRENGQNSHFAAEIQRIPRLSGGLRRLRAEAYAWAMRVGDDANAAAAAVAESELSKMSAAQQVHTLRAHTARALHKRFHVSF